MPSPRKLTPSYVLHKQSGRGRAVWYDHTDTRRQKLLPGLFNSPESRTAFARFQLELEACPASAVATDPETTLAVLLSAYLDHAEKHYRGPDGRPTSEIYEVKIVIRALLELYADTPVAEFGPLAVKDARQKWVGEKRCRRECNRRVGVVKRIFKWAVSEELAPPAVYQAIATVTGLQKGRTTPHETEPVGPVGDEVVDATLPFLNRFVAGMVEFQRLTGCRPGEVCALRRYDIDTGGAGGAPGRRPRRGRRQEARAHRFGGHVAADAAEDSRLFRVGRRRADVERRATGAARHRHGQGGRGEDRTRSAVVQKRAALGVPAFRNRRGGRAGTHFPRNR